MPTHLILVLVVERPAARGVGEANRVVHLNRAGEGQCTRSSSAASLVPVGGRVAHFLAGCAVLDSAMQLRSPHPARRGVRVGDDIAGAAGIHCVGHDAWGVWAPIRGRTYGLMRASQDQHTSKHRGAHR